MTRSGGSLAKDTEVLPAESSDAFQPCATSSLNFQGLGESVARLTLGCDGVAP